MEKSSLQRIFLWPATPLRRQGFPDESLNAAVPDLSIVPTTGRAGESLLNPVFPKFLMFVPSHPQVGNSDGERDRCKHFDSRHIPFSLLSCERVVGPGCSRCRPLSFLSPGFF
jgi:hypothetical protein